ncbi:alpha-ketoglutaric semialdehyde dehydrogenase GucD [Neobacillus drentensis]|uniref:alpha-ketoglutaric semialdehyde dehydrogenase GucD n=1 Tax=Neobacillus drentensis TaxID=220684 RepID=UPI0030003143
MTLTTLNFINGEWVSAQNGSFIRSINPSDLNEVVGTIADSTIEDLDDAVQAAKRAGVSWRKLSAVDRGNFLHKAADILENNVDEIAEIATREMGKVLHEMKGEVKRGVAILRYFAQEGMRQTGEVLPSAQSNNFLYTKRVPIGVVGIITPWNFPVAIPLWKIAPALIYGNTVVFKSASETGITAAKLVEVFNQAGIPGGVINFINGKGSVIGQGMVEHNDIHAISFTGSNEVGKQIAIGMAARGAKYQLEMGGKNPVIVLEDADLDLAANLTVLGAMKQTGQRCTATSKAFVQRSVYDRFKERVIEKVQSLKVGPGLFNGIDMGPLASKNQLDSVVDYIDKGLTEGATLLAGGRIPMGSECKNGFFIEPTVFGNVTNNMVIAKEEIFGPVLCLIKVESLDEAIELANDNMYGLSASLFTKDLAKAFIFADQIEAGLVQINGETGGAEPQAPFGGMKASSSHSREQGQAAKEFFTTIKTITITP